MTALAYARSVMERIEVLARFSEEPDCLTRRSFSDAMRQANDAVAVWMRGAGMAVRQDHIGNLVGRYDATGERARTLILGSHLDTVRNAGKYDGPLGVLIALASVERLHERKERLPFAVEVICFADEEGLRFGSTYLGSRVVAGTFGPDDLHLADADGVTLAEAIRTFGGDPEALDAEARQPGDVLGYCEVHIEQGPVLEQHDLPVGVVAAIAGQSRINVSFEGEAGHAGTVPMTLRRDALCAAAEFVLAVEALAQEEPGLVATVGQIAVEPGASNVIPGHVSLSLDVRHQDDAQRTEARRRLNERAQAIGAARNVAPTWHVLQESPAVPCEAHLTGLLEQAVAMLGFPVVRLPSGAGHDAAAMADLAPVAMLFVRCKGGISHHPAESVNIEDVAVAIDVLSRFLELLAPARED